MNDFTDDELNAFRDALGKHASGEHDCEHCEDETCPLHDDYNGPHAEVYAQVRDEIRERMRNGEPEGIVMVDDDGPHVISREEFEEWKRYNDYTEEDTLVGREVKVKRAPEEIFDNYINGVRDSLSRYANSTEDLAEAQSELVQVELRIRVREAEITHRVLVVEKQGKNAEERKAVVEYELLSDPALFELYKKRAEIQSEIAIVQHEVDLYSRELHSIITLLQSHEKDYETRLKEREYEMTMRLLEDK